MTLPLPSVLCIALLPSHRIDCRPPRRAPAGLGGTPSLAVEPDGIICPSRVVWVSTISFSQNEAPRGENSMRESGNGPRAAGPHPGANAPSPDGPGAALRASLDGGLSRRQLL